MPRIPVLAVLVLLFASAPAFARSPKSGDVRIHTVYQGQRLGSIAKRYNVTIAALCHANDISRGDPIHPKQKLIIPERDDEDGSEARRLRLAGALKKDVPRPGAARGGTTETAGREERSSRPGKPRVHTVYSGQRLGSIAKRYNVSVEALCNANGFDRRDPIFPGQKLLVPARNDRDGSHAREIGRAALSHDEPDAVPPQVRAAGASWKKYEKEPWRRGYVTLVGHDEKWTGYVIGPGNKVLSGARRAISRVLTARSNRRLVHSRLVRLLAAVSDTFGGRPLRIVSGYRTTSYVKGSRHKVGRAVDFRIPGIPNEVLRDYLRTFDDVGVGYYPNSSFVHFDVRDRSAYWVDYAGPGEPPRYRRATRGNTRRSPTDDS